MAVTYIQERQGGAERSSGKLTRFRVLLFHATAGSNPGDILLDEKIPADGSRHPDYPGFYCIGISSPQKVSGGEVDGSYTVQVNYSSSAGDIPAQKDNTGKPPWQQKAYNVSIGSVRVVVPQIKAYQSGDKQFQPSKPVIHPVTGEVLISDTLEIHPTLSFSYALKDFQFLWVSQYLNTSNASSVVVLGMTFPAFTLLLTNLAVSMKQYTDSASNTTNYFEATATIEYFGRPTTKELAYQGYLHIADNKIRPIQLSDGAYGFFDERRPDLNISSPRFVDKNGAVLAAGGTINAYNGDYYGTYNDIFDANWSPLSLPKGPV